MPLDETYPGPAESPEKAAVVRDALRRLEERHRRLLELVYEAGFTHAEVAAMSKSSPGAVKTAVYRARRAFIELFEQE